MLGFEGSLALGIGLGLAYALATHATHWLAYRFPARFVEIALGGLVVRLLFTLALLFAVLALVPMRHGAFVGGFAAAFVVGLVREVAVLARVRRPAPSASV